MQLRLPWTTPQSGVRTIDAGGRTFPVQVVRHRAARRYILRITATGTVRVTVPGRASIAGALVFAEAQAEWIATEWSRRHARGAWAHGTPVWYRGEQYALSCTRAEIRCGPCVVARPDLDTPVRSLLQAAWRAEAAMELPGRCLALGAAHGLVPGRIQVRNQQSRWGSCSSRGNVALNWRLVQMPDDVADYVMLHELVHLEHPNHSSRFWRRVAVVCPAWRTAERWLRVSGRDLL